MRLEAQPGTRSLRCIRSEPRASRSSAVKLTKKGKANIRGVHQFPSMEISISCRVDKPARVVLPGARRRLEIPTTCNDGAHEEALEPKGKAGSKAFLSLLRPPISLLFLRLNWLSESSGIGRIRSLPVHMEHDTALSVRRRAAAFEADAVRREGSGLGKPHTFRATFGESEQQNCFLPANSDSSPVVNHGHRPRHRDRSPTPGVHHVQTCQQDRSNHRRHQRHRP
ncbi:hypothetical protein ABIE40_005625 [Rhizobium sp. OAE497]